MADTQALIARVGVGVAVRRGAPLPDVTVEALKASLLRADSVVYNQARRGSHIPKTTKNSYPISEGQPVAIQLNDVDIDHRGLAYAVDRAGAGLFILEYTGSKTRQTTN
jgi:hypothetical protein